MEKSVVVSIRNAAKTDFGGGEKVPVYIARETMKHSPHIEVIVCSASEKLLEFAKQESVPHMKTWWWQKQDWSGKKALLFPAYVVWQLILTLYYVGLFIRLRPSVVHLQSKDDFIGGTFAARLVGARIIWSDYADLKHIWKNHTVWYKNPIGKLVYFAARFAKMIIVVSKEDKRLILENMPGSLVSSKMTIIYNGAFDTFKHLPKKEDFTIVSASRLVIDKGVGELIEAFLQFNTQHPETKLNILGDGPDREHFVKMSGDNPTITFLGHQKNPAEHIETAHVFAMPTYHEGFSLALVEACMLEMAIVATEIGGNVEIIKDNYNGLLVDVKDSDALYDAFKKLYKDKALREKLATNARAEYEKSFNFQSIIIDNFVPLYTKARS